MKMSEIAAGIEQFCPGSFAEDWDNTGLLAGDSNREIKRVLLAVDATSAAVDLAVREHCDALITHHPLIFRDGIRHVSDGDYIGKRIVRLLHSDICCYAMHTNFDVMGMGDAAADALKLTDREVLKVTFEDDISHEGFGRIGTLPEHMTLHECALYVKETFGIPHVRYWGDPEQPIVVAAVLPGSGKDEIEDAIRAGADVMITGDITHHVGIDSLEKGIALIDAGHYGIEKIFMPYMKDFFAREMPSLEVLTFDADEVFGEV